MGNKSAPPQGISKNQGETCLGITLLRAKKHAPGEREWPPVGRCKSHPHVLQRAIVSADDMWGGLRDMGGAPSEPSSSGLSLTVRWRPVSSAVSYVISRGPEQRSLLPVLQRAWDKTRLLSLGAREEFPGLYVRTYFPITVPSHSLMRQPDISQQKEKEEALFSYISCGSINCVCWWYPDSMACIQV